MEARPIQPGDYAVLTYAGKSQTYLVKNISLEGIYISPLTDPTQKILLTEVSEAWKVQGSVIDYGIEFASKENPPLIFTNVSELDIQMLNNLDDDTLQSACQMNKYISDLCRKDELWERRVNKYFPGKELKPTGVSWKDYYLTLSKEKGKLYIVIHIDVFHEIRTFLIGVYQTKESAAEATFNDAIKRLEIESDVNPEGMEFFMTVLGDLTKAEFIEEILKSDGMEDEAGIVYQIFEYDEHDIKS